MATRRMTTNLFSSSPLILAFLLASQAGAQPRIATASGPDPTQPGNVRIYDVTPTFDLEIAAFSTMYGANVTFADVNNDGKDDVIAGAGAGQVNAPRVRGLKIDGTPIQNFDFMAYGSGQWGVDLVGIQIPSAPGEELITVPGPGAVFAPQVRGWYYDMSVVPPSVAPLSKINYFAGGLGDHATLGKGDFNGDGWEDYVTSLGPSHGWGLDVRAFSCATGAPQQLFRALMGGVSVHATGADVDGDSYDEFLVGTGTSSTGFLRGYNYDGAGLTAIAGIGFVPLQCLQCGIIPSSGNLDGDIYDEILVSSTAGPNLKAFNYDGASISPLWSLKPFPTTRFGLHHTVSDSTF